MESEEPKEKKKLSKRTIIIAAVVVVVIIILAIILTSSEDSLLNGNDNQPPAADAGQNINVTVGQRVLFDGSNSTDPDGDELIYHWEFSDGPKYSEEKFYRYFNTTGDFTVKLTVNDGKEQSSAEITIKVNPEGPTGPPEVDLEAKPAAPLIGIYNFIVRSAEPEEQLANFTFAIRKASKDGPILYKNDVSALGTTGNVSFIDSPTQTLLDTNDNFMVNPDTTLPAEDGDFFVLYYKFQGDEVELDYEEFKTAI
ncbi:MAG: PKD domain-containing protein [Thermoplasmata archaeon]|nr:MAG: PKD domain-containing protein [Thermoplasmata archaeon]